MAKRSDTRTLEVRLRFYAKGLPAKEVWAEGTAYVPVNVTLGAKSRKDAKQFDGLDNIALAVKQALDAHGIKLRGRYAR